MARFETDGRDLPAEWRNERTRTHSTRDVSDFLVSLDADDPKRRASAAWSLAKVAASTPERVPISDLSEAVTDDDPWVRRGATWALAEIAQEHPSDARPAMEHVCNLVGDEDQLVRENAVIAVAGVAEEYPRTVQPALDSLLDLRNSRRGNLRRYATEALRHVVDSLSGATLDGTPVVISVSDPQLTDLLPAGANVVQNDGNENGPSGVRVKSTAEVREEERSTSEATTRQSPRFGTEPPSPDDISSPSSLSVTDKDFEKVRSLGRSPLVTVEQARASTPREQHAMVTLFTLRPDRREASVSESFTAAIDRWSAIDDHDHVLSIRARGDAPPTPTAVNSDLPDAVDELLERALAKRKSDRYETVDDVLVALEHAIANHSDELMGRII